MPEPGATQSSDPHAIVLFDGVCNLCNHSVRFVIERDPESYFRFASLQSDVAVELLSRYGRAPVSAPPDSIVLIENGRVFESSTAALRIARRLRGAWKFLYFFIVIPRPIRDAVYRWIARNRYRWFGTREDVCLVPPAGAARAVLPHAPLPPGPDR